MKITISSRPIKLTESVYNYINNKVNKLENHLNSEDEVKILITYDKEIYKIEITILSTDSTIIRSESSDEDLYFAADMVLERIAKQLIRYKYKMKFESKFNSFDINNESIKYQREEKDQLIERHKKFNLKPMSVEEAIMQMELIGHNFYMFRNQETYEINIVYKRYNGGYGLIEHE
ncbi:ribosome hibernation-promoting factor, HPF/YfiA family [Romboutsia lituseburensis]|uniref:ribosome hibernation-promoting factor, HPF/YfiA family n=1 Tax=Romboutsia lituseburensis TaxID=1537 RepID=UPI00215B5EBA|nr:ribosome-associated translation inhibitor RaiA [Romboutsia lituseburensis]MCR8746587.1 ribosome-associated translation inhibitor RaiA [Romboutsia lituseburensis]